MSTTTGAKIGTAMKTIAIHSMKVPSTTRMPIMTRITPNGGRSSPATSPA